MLSSTDGRHFTAFVGGQQKIDAAVYSIGGQLVLHATAAGDEIGIDASSLAPGCYIIKVNNQSQKFIVK